ncbi:heavy metal-associated isoprenylated plant protein 7 isoform X2 [Brachypodium distachyon]|uniref:heavy metal-associated isoprenylated plant protein 7 isoform X2 n=1 Tax=Brachypodium distachyon TaxID=15368 RepID=UPI0005300165|nr:heavy metal-associated isoprenylated plant protein 7 isoform X2 [Brachypodium distachyon]|eukprot:XP_010227396.1 heavy metal-associated isoprenylated plant protein 7 isoform X2 [Brachypodium distachyon]
MAKWRTKKTAAAAASGGDKAGGDKLLPPVKGRRSDAPADQEVVMISVPVHCDGCARKVRRSLLRLDGVEEATVEYSTNTVVVMGRKALEDPMKVVETVERRTGKKALLLSPSPGKLPPPPSSVDTEETKKHDVADLDMEMVVVLRIELHCDACCEEMKRRILNIKGVEEAVPDMKSSELMVRGTVEPATLVGFIHKCTGRKAAIIRAEPLMDPPPAEAMAAEPLTDVKTPAVDANVEQQERPSDNLEEKNEGVKEEMKMEEPSKGNGVELEEETKKNIPDDASSGVTEENQLMKDHLFNLPMPAAVVGVEPAESQKMAMNNIYPYYYQQPACAYGYPNYAYQPYQQYPAYQPCQCSAYQPYGPCPHCPQQTSGYENPDGCTIM